MRGDQVPGTASAFRVALDPAFWVIFRRQQRSRPGHPAFTLPPIQDHRAARDSSSSPRLGFGEAHPRARSTSKAICKPSRCSATRRSACSQGSLGSARATCRLLGRRNTLRLEEEHRPALDLAKSFYSALARCREADPAPIQPADRTLEDAQTQKMIWDARKLRLPPGAAGGRSGLLLGVLPCKHGPQLRRSSQVVNISRSNRVSARAAQRLGTAAIASSTCATMTRNIPNHVKSCEPVSPRSACRARRARELCELHHSSTRCRKAGAREPAVISRATPSPISIRGSRR